MFTGLVEGMGEVLQATAEGPGLLLRVRTPFSPPVAELGASIAINGVCLTATSISDTGFTADVMVHTLKMTSLASYNVGDRVNLELAAKLEARMGGHMVQGHVDGVATVLSIVDGQKWQEFTVTIPANLLKYVVAQGSICIEGVSLTVGALNDANNEVTVWLIPETLAKTNLSVKKIGDPLNIEVDVLAKYVERLLEKR